MNYQEKLKLLRDKNTSAEILAQLSKDKSFETNRLIAWHTNTSNKTLNKILELKDVELSFNVYNRKKLDAALKERLKPFQELFDALNKQSQIIEHYSSFYSQLIITLKSFKLNDKALEELSNNKDLGIRVAIAQNPHSPLKILEQLLASNNTDAMQEAVAGNPNTSFNILNELIKINRLSLKFIIYCRNNNETNIEKQLKKYELLFSAIASEKNYSLFSYKFKSVIDTVALENELIEELAADDSFGTRAIIASSAQTPTAILKKLFLDNEPRVVAEFAKNPNTPTEILQELIKTSDIYILEGIAQNPNTPVELLLKLSEYKAKTVKEALAGNILTSKSPEKLNELIRHKKFRRPVSKNPFISTQIMEILSNDKDYSVRNAIAKNFNTPFKILQKLLNDRDDLVRHSAKNSLDKKRKGTKKPGGI